jgi:4a-hydroxytetrahydrobiopterin dehydratase
MPEAERRTKLDAGGIAARKAGIDVGWDLVGGHLVRAYPFPDFASGLAFVNEVGRVAEDMNHHPQVQLGWGEVRLELWTHSAGGLTGRDFELARLADEAYRLTRAE